MQAANYYLPFKLPRELINILILLPYFCPFQKKSAHILQLEGKGDDKHMYRVSAVMYQPLLTCNDWGSELWSLTYIKSSGKNQPTQSVLNRNRY